jgi:cysteine-rich repeat protein
MINSCKSSSASILVHVSSLVIQSLSGTVRLPQRAPCCKSLSTCCFSKGLKVSLLILMMTYALSCTCGNGVIESGEICDDGNVASADGCSSTCFPEHWHSQEYLPPTSTSTRASNLYGSSLALDGSYALVYNTGTGWIDVFWRNESIWMLSGTIQLGVSSYGRDPNDLKMKSGYACIFSRSLRKGYIYKALGDGTLTQVLYQDGVDSCDVDGPYVVFGDISYKTCSSCAVTGRLITRSSTNGGSTWTSSTFQNGAWRCAGHNVVIFDSNLIAFAEVDPTKGNRISRRSNGLTVASMTHNSVKPYGNSWTTVLANSNNFAGVAVSSSVVVLWYHYPSGLSGGPSGTFHKYYSKGRATAISAALDGNTLYLGMPSCGINRLDQGCVKRIEYTGGAFVEQTPIYNRHTERDSQFGQIFSLSGNTVLVGWPSRNVPDFDSFGAIHFLSLCGNGVLDVGEACDDGNVKSNDGCNATCQYEPGWNCTSTLPTICSGCGDGILSVNEACDDGNRDEGDGCSSTCTIESGWSCSGKDSKCQLCGNSIVEGSEMCDDGNSNANDGCNSCNLQPGWSCSGSSCSLTCGDGEVGGNEKCDDGNNDNSDGCSSACTVEPGWECTGDPSSCSRSCGNGAVGVFEACDDGNGNDNDGCSSSCNVEYGWYCTGAPSICNRSCGNGAIAGIEVCDDGNTINGDGCNSRCNVEYGWQCLGSPSSCTPSCGDGSRRGNETCDDGNGNGNDGCSSNCQTESGWICVGEPSLCTPVCGDASQRGNEACDDGNSIGNDGCSSRCLVEVGWQCQNSPSDCSTVCGDGLIAGSEACDDHNTNNGDGCSSLCAVEEGWTCAMQQGGLYCRQVQEAALLPISRSDAPSEGGSGLS